MSIPSQRAFMARLTPLATAGAVVLLMGVLLQGTGEALHARLLKVGESVWPGYAALRQDPVKPDCKPDGPAAPVPTGEGDAFADDLMGDEPAPAPAPAPGDAAKPTSPPEGGGGDSLDELLEDEPTDAGASAAAVAAAQQACKEKHAAYEEQLARRTAGLVAFVILETSLAGAVLLGISYLQHTLVLLLLICALAATVLRGHIGLRPVRTLIDDRVSEGSQLLANILLLITSYYKWQVDLGSGVAVQNASLPVLWMIGFAILILINVYNLVRPATGLAPGGSWAVAGLCMPLYASMALISGAYFFLAESHPSGLAIYLQKITEHALLYIHVGLYVWAGMLLKQTRLSALSFDVVRGFKLPPELLAFVVVAVSAVPTAYSGASGIFVIAAGAVIFKELKQAGARTQLAMAATAMSGSLGVVLSPCLLVVIVASLNKQVTTDQLYGWGWKVYLLTAVLFLLFTVLARSGPWSIAPWSEAKQPTLTAVRALVPYGLVLAFVLVAYGVVLGTTLDEHSAPMMLPAVLLIMLLFDRRRSARAPQQPAAEHRGAGHAIVEATSETTQHIGALLMLMSLSVCLGGVIERGELMALVPQSLGSPFIAMVVLVAVLVLIGMIMDPYGAVILVSAAIADIAYRNGIDPVHFWMVVLVAFELGYLSPPVALNHLLTRQVVGDAGDVVEEPGSFYRRHERVLMPLAVMALALLVVAFVPLLWT